MRGWPAAAAAGKRHHLDRGRPGSIGLRARACKVAGLSCPLQGLETKGEQMIHRSWSSVGGRTLLHVSVAGRAAATVEEETRAAIATAVADIRRFGVNDEHIVRSRIWSRDSTVRQIASDV